MDIEREYKDTTRPHVMAVALPPGSPEVSRLETDRREIFEGVRRGFARTYEALVEEVGERGRRRDAAYVCFPEEILEYDLSEIEAGGGGGV